MSSALASSSFRLQLAALAVKHSSELDVLLIGTIVPFQYIIPPIQTKTVQASGWELAHTRNERSRFKRPKGVERLPHSRWRC
ncbi:MAG: hypothetical protein IJ319_03025, partial [Bacteroidaceae bacterium]|nr:hypothetical protein [Bacteroidaceae bacterium]